MSWACIILYCPESRPPVGPDALTTICNCDGLINAIDVTAAKNKNQKTLCPEVEAQLKLKTMVYIMRLSEI